MKKITPKDIATLLLSLTKDKDEKEVKEVVKEVALLMQKKGLLSKEKEILNEYFKLYNESEGVEEVTITLQERLSPKAQSEVKKMLKEMFSVKDVYVREKVDQRILGGIKIETGRGLLVDGTVQGKLTSLRNTLTR